MIVPETVALDRREFPPDRPDRAPQKLVDVMVRFTIFDADSGEQLVGQMPGSAEERGDGTGVSKALTDSNKNFLQKLFELTAQDEAQNGRRARPAQAPVAPKPSNGASGNPAPAVISPAQAKRMFALAGEYQVEVDKLKDYLFREHNFAHSKDVTRERYETVCGWISNGGK